MIWLGVVLAALVAAVVFHAVGLRGGFSQVADALRGLRGAVEKNTEATRLAAERAASAEAAGKAMHAVLQGAAKDARKSGSGRRTMPSYGGEDTLARETPLPIEGS